MIILSRTRPLQNLRSGCLLCCEWTSNVSGYPTSLANADLSGLYLLSFSGHGEREHLTEVKVAPRAAYPLTPGTVFSRSRTLAWFDTVCCSSACSTCCLSASYSFQRKTEVILTELQLFSPFPTWHHPSSKGSRTVAQGWGRPPAGRSCRGVSTQVAVSSRTLFSGTV